MSTDEHPITDTQRLEAMFHKGWRVSQQNGLFCVPGITKWKPTPRAAVDAAIASDGGKAATDDDFATDTWDQWQIRVFPPTASKTDIRRIARDHGWSVSVRKIRKTGEWHVMATAPV